MGVFVKICNMLPIKNVKKSVQQKVKESNLSAIFKLIAENGGISRVDIAKRVGLSTSTVSTLTDELLHRRVIIETGEVKSGDVGRRAIRLQINPFGGFFVCLLFFKKEFRIDIYNLEEKLESSCKVPCDEDVVTSGYIISKIQENTEFGYKYGKFFGLLFVLPSWSVGANGNELMKERFGYVFEEDCFRSIKNYYKKTLVLAEADATLSANERFYDASLMHNSTINVLHLNVDDNASSYLVINGEILDGKNGIRDFGKVGVNFLEDGDNAQENQGGKLSNYATVSAIKKNVEAECGKALSFSEIISESRKGNQKVVKVIDLACRALAYAIVNVAEIIDLKAVVIGGEIALLGQSFKGLVCDYVSLYDKGLRNLFVKFFEDNKLISQCGMYYLFDEVFNSANIENATVNV